MGGKEQFSGMSSVTPSSSSTRGAGMEPESKSAHYRPAFVHSSTSYANHHNYQQNSTSSSSVSMSSSSSASASSKVTQMQTQNNKIKSSYSDAPLSHNQYTQDYEYSNGYDHDDYDYPVSKESYPPSDRPLGSGRNQLGGPATGNGPSSSRFGELQMHHIHLPTDSRERFGNGNGNSNITSTIERIWVKIREKSVCACSCSGEGGLGKAMMIGWIVTTVVVLAVLAWWRGELFEALDNLSKELASMGHEGKAIIFILILITTIPPVPLYSTLIVLSGYTFGVWDGFVVSYAASLVGAVMVFVVSRCWLKDVITKSLAHSPTSISILNILPSNPHLLLLIRIAPYPYNLLNVILASSPTLTLRTYTGCTAISLCKLVLHTWIGAGVHDLSASYGHGGAAAGDGSKNVSEGLGDDSGTDEDESWPHPFPPPSHHHPHPYHHVYGHGHGHGQGHPPMDSSREDVKAYSTWIGIFLCVGLFFYLTHLAKKALKKAQEEQEDRERAMREGGDGSGIGLLSGRESEEV